MSARDPYQVLGVSRDATAEELKTAYRRLAKEFHPDSDPGNPWIENKFKEVSAAYDLLSDPVKRGHYDKGWIDPDGNLRRRKGAGPDPRARRGRSGRGEKVEVRGANVAYTLWITFAEAARGTVKRVRLTTGKEVEVKVPAGTADGVTLRLKNQGMGGIGGAEPGDAHVEVKVEGDPRFTAKGKDVFSDIAISLPEAVLGDKVEVETLDAVVAVNVPAGANSGTVLRLKGKGLGAEGERGDHYVTLKVVLPDVPDAELTEFVRKWAKKHPYTVKRT